MNAKEKYLSAETLIDDILLLISDLNQDSKKLQKWNATLSESALIVTDLQNYFLNPGSHAYIPSAPAILGNIKKLTAIFRNAGQPVIYTRHTNSLTDAGMMAHWWKDLIHPESKSSELIDGFCYPGDIILEKHQYDAFYGTNLDDVLKKNKVSTLVICGVMTNLCCETTLRTAFVKGYHPVLPIDATAAYNRKLHLATFSNLAFGFAPVITVDELINLLKK